MRKLPILIALLAFTAHAQELSLDETRGFLQQLTAARGTSAFQADFSEVKTVALLQKPVKESGVISFLPPNNFRREASSGNLTVCDGETLWLYYPEFREAEKYSLSKNRTLRESITAMTSGLRLDQLDKMFTISVMKSEDGYRLTLTPRSAALKKNVSKLIINLSSGFAPRDMEILGAEGDRTVTTFSNERRVKLSAEDFRFQPPSGISISEPLGK